MSWNTDTEHEQYRREAEIFLSLPQAQQDAVTWEQAEGYVLCDTLTFARWQGCKHTAQSRNRPPAEALREFFWVYYGLTTGQKEGDPSE